MSNPKITFDVKKYQSGIYEPIYRNGTTPRAVTIYSKEPADGEGHPRIVTQNEHGLLTPHKEDGASMIGWGEDLFLISKPVTRHVNVYDNGSFGYPRRTREEADRRAAMTRGKVRVACAEITYTPGQGI